MNAALVDPARLEAICLGREGDPFAVLGAHGDGDGGWIVRAFLPGADEVQVVAAAQSFPLAMLDPRGFFAGRVSEPPERLLRVRRSDVWSEHDDPYRFGLVLGSEDSNAIRGGRCWRLFDVLGAQPRLLDGARGVAFAVWAPEAQRVSLVAAANGWNACALPMRFRHECGVWEIFVPGFDPDAPYAFDVLARGAPLGRRRRDPVGDWVGADASRALPRFEEKRATAKPFEPGSRAVFVDPHADEHGSEIAAAAAAGATHVIIDLPAPRAEGAPCALFAGDSALGGLAGVAALVRSVKARGLGVLAAFDMMRFANDPAGLARFDGTSLYECADGGEGRPHRWRHARWEAANLLISAALFWTQRIGFDGLRIGPTYELLDHDENGAAAWMLRQVCEIAGDAGITLVADSPAPAMTAPTRKGGFGFSLATEDAASAWRGWPGDHRRIARALAAAPAERCILSVDGPTWPVACALPHGLLWRGAAPAGACALHERWRGLPRMRIEAAPDGLRIWRMSPEGADEACAVYGAADPPGAGWLPAASPVGLRAFERLGITT